MKIGAVLGVKDEVELIERAIAHLRAIGVETIVACDDTSTDGTQDILEAHRSRDRSFSVVNTTRWGTDPEDWSRGQLEVVRSIDADWVLFLDADEFWIPEGGTLRPYVEQTETEVFSVARFNVPLGPAGPYFPLDTAREEHGETLLFVDPIPDFYSHMKENARSPWSRGVPVPKVLARRDLVASVAVGGHDVDAAAGILPRKLRPADLVIAHLPFTTRERFARKLDNIRSSIAAYPQMFRGRLGWHWRRWLALAEEGKLDEEFARNVFDAAAIAELRSSGVIQSAEEIFRNPATTAKPHPLP